MIIQDGMWSVTEAFAKFGFEDGDGVDYGAEIAEEFETAGFTVQRAEGIHNAYITQLHIPGDDPEGGSFLMEFDGYEIPRWAHIPEEVKEVILKLDPSMTSEYWEREARDSGLDIT